ncbi:hypothetical protein GQ42DRAFT_165602 [Ramicandelaber brevisporus]|nr:hypothetical protein GQ42DRAFT_165602 [Ramicandelaber brevisporus]
MNFTSPFSPRSSVAFLSADEIAPTFIASSAANSRSPSRSPSRSVTPRASLTKLRAEPKTPQQEAIDATFDKSFSTSGFLTSRML